MDQRTIESVGLFLLLSVKKGTLLKVLKNELGGGKQRKKVLNLKTVRMPCIAAGDTWKVQAFNIK